MDRRGLVLMGHVTELCGQCGFEIPVDEAGCPGCRRVEATPSLAARQLAGEALPTRSVHALHTVAPRREPLVDDAPANGARAAFVVTWVLVLVALLGIALGWMVRLAGVGPSVPDGLRQGIDTLTTVASLASVIGLGVGLAAGAVHVIRHLVVVAARWLAAHEHLLGS